MKRLNMLIKMILKTFVIFSVLSCMPLQNSQLQDDESSEKERHINLYVGDYDSVLEENLAAIALSKKVEGDFTFCELREDDKCSGFKVESRGENDDYYFFQLYGLKLSDSKQTLKFESGSIKETITLKSKSDSNDSSGDDSEDKNSESATANYGELDVTFEGIKGTFTPSKDAPNAKYMIVDYSADWCGACISLASQTKDTIAKMNTDKCVFVTVPEKDNLMGWNSVTQFSLESHSMIPQNGATDKQRGMNYMLSIGSMPTSLPTLQYYDLSKSGNAKSKMIGQPSHDSNYLINFLNKNCM